MRGGQCWVTGCSAVISKGATYRRHYIGSDIGNVITSDKRERNWECRVFIYINHSLLLLTTHMTNTGSE